MSETKIKTLTNSLHKAESWIDEVQTKLQWEDENEAYTAMKAVLHALRDRLSVDENAHITAQMPLVIRGIYFEGWKPSTTPIKIRHVENFLDLVCAHASDNPCVIDEVDTVTRAVLEVLMSHISQGSIEKLKLGWPKALQTIWPDSPF